MGGPFGSAADAGDALGADLGRNAHGHGAVVVDADVVAHRKAAGLVGVDLDLLAGAAVAYQQAALLYLQNGGAHGSVQIVVHQNPLHDHCMSNGEKGNP